MNPFSRRSPMIVLALAVGAVGGVMISDRLQGQAIKPLNPPLEITSFRDVAKRVLPAVVSIEAKVDLTQRAKADPLPAPALPPGIPEEFRRFFELMPPTNPLPPSPNLGFGSGVLISADGIVLTNSHVVDAADSVEVTLEDGRSYTSKDIRRDSKSDLAVIKLNSDKPFPFLTFADSDQVEVGDRVLAVGAPFGLTGSVTHGIISAKSRQNLRLNQYEDFLQTDAAINPGNSGGPLIDLTGRIVGINAAIRTRSGGFQGVGLAISSNLARDVAEQLMKHGVVRRGYLGVGIRALTEELAARLGVPGKTGVVVTKVYANSPAANAGLQVGDVITHIGGNDINDLNTLPKIVAKLPIGQPTELRYVRDGTPALTNVTIETQPEDFGTRSQTLNAPRPVEPRGQTDANYGLSVATLTPEAAARLGYPRGTTGVLITAVDRGSAAFDAGLSPGQVIIKVDRTKVNTVDDWFAAMQKVDPGQGALLHLLRPTGEVDFTVLKSK